MPEFPLALLAGLKKHNIYRKIQESAIAPQEISLQDEFTHNTPLKAASAVDPSRDSFFQLPSDF